MNALPVPIVVIDEEQRDRYLETGYNPPADGYDEKKFLAELQSVHNEVETAVGEHWKPWLTGTTFNWGLNDDGGDAHDRDDMDDSDDTDDHDFFMSEDHFGPTRFLCIEVSKERMLTPKLLRIVHKTLSGFEPDYSVDICNSWTVLKTEDGNKYPDFNIFVEKKQILIYTESEALFEKLGIDPHGLD